MVSADVILFAIQGAVKLGTQARAAYVDATARRELVLPLPDFKPGNNALAAMSFYRQQMVTAPEGLRLLVDKLRQGTDLTEQERASLLLYHNEHVLGTFAGDAGFTLAADGSAVTQPSLAALVTVRQWQRDPNPTYLQRMAGSFIEIGIDYFATGPGVSKLTFSHADALRALLTGLDQIEFSTEVLGSLPQRLFSVAMETMTAHPEVFSADRNVQQILTASTRGLVRDVNARIEVLRKAEGANELKETGIRSWGEVVFRSLLSSTGTLLVEEPGRFLGVRGESQAALVSAVGGAALALVLDRPDASLADVFSQAGLDAVTKAALRLVAQYPALVTHDARLTQLVSQISSSLSRMDGPVGAAMVPDVARLVLERTADNLPLLWPDAVEDPKRHLALVAAQTTLDVLARQPKPGDRWQVQWRRDDLVGVVDSVLGDLVHSPGWLVQAGTEVSPQLGVALEAMVAVLRARGDPRLSSALATQLLRSGLAAAALRSEFLAPVPGRGPVVAVVLDVVLAATLGPTVEPHVAWCTVRDEVLAGLVDAAYAKLGQSRLAPSMMAVLEATMASQFATIGAGEAWCVLDFAGDLETRLKTV
jgi:hypothetical protein